MAKLNSELIIQIRFVYGSNVFIFFSDPVNDLDGLWLHFGLNLLSQDSMGGGSLAADFLAADFLAPDLVVMASAKRGRRRLIQDRAGLGLGTLRTWLDLTVATLALERALTTFILLKIVKLNLRLVFLSSNKTFQM